ncbi:MAG: hypothetical protein A3J06_04785 [Candidatus Moranbacteria bacterium RIFCSPLOWO2_02_FULL_48_19]|nr:MAG: hypothetical protein A3J06_04785 [Candidatus Moranbacteria bacterium RIFCSPLOWO2_02_FULL_48_19]OGI30480.1 MAG: hypothetical protein A3G09_05025 [Candidatus Moranbacteria bacterium RIFCSPLOWO2_12_FULL_48_12]
MATLWEKIRTLEGFQKKNTLPEVPGVYFFLDAKKKLLYIGKATSLRDRVKSYYQTKRVERKFTFISERSAGKIGFNTRYFSQDIGAMRGPKIELMLDKVRFVAYRKIDSVLEALILEANFIKNLQPIYNTDAKDDKSYDHVVVTEELFPRVLIARGRNILKKNQDFGSSTSKIGNQGYKYVFGPFPAGGALREAMKIVRKLFPFRDRCVPFEMLSQAQKEKSKPCFSAQIRLCPGVCTGEITAREYARTINHIRLFFAGHKGALVKNLKREMETAVKKLDFEWANEIKKTLFGLQHIQDMALIKNDQKPITNGQQQEMRVEAYDVAHLGGSASVGVMVVLKDGKPAKEFYRKFTLRGEHKGDDLTALEEILKRRLKHLEWSLPEIIVVDGSESQVAVTKQAVHLEVGLPSDIAVVGVVKNAKHQPQRLIGPEALTKHFKKEILLANNEAHRFAITFHRARRGKGFLS